MVECVHGLMSPMYLQDMGSEPNGCAVQHGNAVCTHEGQAREATRITLPGGQGQAIVINAQNSHIW